MTKPLYCYSVAVFFIFLFKLLIFYKLEVLNTVSMKNLYPFIFCLSLIACNQQHQDIDHVEVEKQLNKNNNQVTVVVNVSYSLNKEEIKSFITEEHAPFFYSLDDTGIVRFEWFINEMENTATLIEVFENASAFQALGSKVLGSPINVRFKEHFTINSLTVLGEVSDEFKEKLQPMGAAFNVYTGGIN